MNNQDNSLKFYANQSILPAGLPIPSEALIQHSQKLLAIIQEEIKHAEVISFTRFMQMALYEPGLGYYSSNLRKFGSQGDYVTAPELSPLFAQCFALQIAEVLRNIADGVVFEVGAGSGIFAVDLLKALKKLDCLPAQYYILEVSADLKHRQQQLLQQMLPEYFSQIVWLEALPQEKIKGVIIANELLDAMPIQKFCVDADGLYELGVALENDKLVWRKFVNDTLQKRINNIQQDLAQLLPVGYESELNPALEAWMQSIADCLEQGIILLIDYGTSRTEYYHQQRDQGTLMCHYQQHAHSDPFVLVGIQDITAYVDFTAVAEAAVHAKLDILGYTTQAHFLLSCGIEQFLPVDTENIQYYEAVRQLKLLTLPGEMGERFKVFAAAKAYTKPLLGMQFQDLTNRL